MEVTQATHAKHAKQATYARTHVCTHARSISKPYLNHILTISKPYLNPYLNLEITCFPAETHDQHNYGKNKVKAFKP